MVIWNKASAFFLVREKVWFTLAFESKLFLFIEVGMPQFKNKTHPTPPP